MNKFLTLLSLIALISYTISDTDACTIGFDISLDMACSALSVLGGDTCTYINNQCQKLYTECADYAPSSNFVNSTCTSITPANKPLKKCIVSKDGKCTEVDKECSDGNNDPYCPNLKAGTDQRCVYFPTTGQCVAHYAECTKAPKTSCATNVPRDHTKTCQYDNNLEKCNEVTRTCEQGVAVFTDKDSSGTDSKTCFDITPGAGKRCIQLSDRTNCQTHYDSCGSITNGTTCNNNYPYSANPTSDKYSSVTNKDKRCKWQAKEDGSGNECVEVDRYCEDYLQDNYFDSSTDATQPRPCVDTNNPSSGFSLISSDGKKVCMLIYGTNKNKCKSEYKDCTVGDSTTCTKIKPLEESRTKYKADYECQYDASCTEKKKPCKNYDNANGDTCTLLDAQNTNMHCALTDEQNNKCEALYNDCDSYNKVVAEASRKAEDCEAIIPTEPLRYCYFNTDTKQCTEDDRPCEKITDKDTCHSQFSSDDNKRCLFLKTGKCVESLRKCDSPGANANKTFCEQIEPEYNEYNRGRLLYHKCVYSEEGETKKCTKTLMNCEDYKEFVHIDLPCSSLTNNIEDNTDGKFRCALSGASRCSKQYSSCNKYDGKDKGICESIPSSRSDYKCVLKYDQKCESEQKSCSEYEGDNEAICKTYKASSSIKECGLVNGHCTEKYKVDTPTEIHFCSDYRGTNKETCEKIQPYYEAYYSSVPSYVSDPVDHSAKCVYNETYHCLRHKIKCNEVSTESECNLIAPDDTDKQCAFVDGRCVEQYKTCQLYEDSVTGDNKVDQSTCEKIVINRHLLSFITDTTTIKYSTHYCKYTAVEGGKGQCRETKRTCEQFIPTIIKSKCPLLSYDESIKCIYTVSGNNVACTQQAKTCLELDSLSVPSGNNLDSICEDAQTSSNKLTCQAKASGYGCEEVNENGDPVIPTSLPQPEDDTSICPKAEECKCSGEKYYLGKIFLALLFCLLA